ncbi:6-phosphogluconolactonase [Halopseudomonas salegens]|uniref:6-phosphogluconolactonase n=1 Tax=Halopseudomonas salegens TaxID=1434072 RepID=A0A1H2E4C4_9GAMM|nr:6-phosphogluconolactonase [Halopseudomonas salegens]SDT90072.1 6-phosphogluconolactonase [Halopseudomonas salegens]
MTMTDIQLPSNASLSKFSDGTELAKELAHAVGELLREVLANQKDASLTVSGGRSPILFFEYLSRQRLDWSRVRIYLADERCVPIQDLESNEGLVRRHLLKGFAASARFFGLYEPCGSHGKAAVRADRALSGLSHIDVLILGMGDDGHTASLFPKSPNLTEALCPDGAKRCLPMLAPDDPKQRLTMSFSMLRTASRVILSIQGANKLATLQEAVGGASVDDMPVRAFLAHPMQIYWCP